MISSSSLVWFEAWGTVLKTKRSCTFLSNVNICQQINNGGVKWTEIVGGREVEAGRNCHSLEQEGLKSSRKGHVSLDVGLGSKSLLGTGMGTGVRRAQRIFQEGLGEFFESRISCFLMLFVQTSLSRFFSPALSYVLGSSHCFCRSARNR